MAVRARSRRNQPRRLPARTGAAPDLVPQPKPVPTAAIPVSMTLPDRNPRAVRGKAVIIIDPGHGGVDPGAIGSVVNTKRTSPWRWRVNSSRRSTPAVATSRPDPELGRVPGAARPRRQGACGGGGSVRVPSCRHRAQPVGARLSVYTLSERASDAESAALAEKENKADLIAGLDLSHESPEVTNILIDLASASR